MKPTQINLSAAELHFLINEHMQKDPRHALSDLMRDRVGINYELQFGSPVEESITGPDRDCPRDKFYELYRSHRKFVNWVNDLDPAGGHGLESHI